MLDTKAARPGWYPGPGRSDDELATSVASTPPTLHAQALEMGDLSTEMTAAHTALTDRHRADLIGRFGVPAELVNRRNVLGFGRVLVEGDRFQFDPDIGRPAYILAARGDRFGEIYDLNPCLLARVGPLLDLVAILGPDRWALRRGAVTVLGAAEPPLVADPLPTPVARTPLSWLQAGAIGLCPLTRNQREVQSILLQLVHGVYAEDDAHARALRDIATRPWQAPPIVARPWPVGARPAMEAAE